MRHVVVFATACVLAPLPLAAQSHPLEGAWSINYVGGMSHQGGATTMIMANGTLTVEAKADSLIATLVQHANNELPSRPPVRMATLRGSGAAVFVVRSPVQIDVGGDPIRATSVSTWTLTATGDSIEGSVARRLEDAGDIPIPSSDPQPVTGKRVAR